LLRKKFSLNSQNDRNNKIQKDDNSCMKVDNTADGEDEINEIKDDSQNYERPDFSDQNDKRQKYISTHILVAFLNLKDDEQILQLPVVEMDVRK
jgi:hypothetical protein